MPRNTRMTGLLLLGLLAAACAPAEPPANPDEVLQQYDAYNAAFGANDVETVLAFYTDDAVRLPSDGSIITGLTIIRDSMVAFRGQNDYLLDEYSTPEIQISGDLAVTYSTFDEHWTSKASGESTRQMGRWLVVWERQDDGSWKIAKEMWTAEGSQ
ncbi:MAG: nuclear transport factor 2 family protein [Gemmatimonadota bacterium]|nr:nuclear transport factor 2 family protein [Gemmatimonadota bacterium]MDH3569462.1 nuclear transport factor 2 family protein [Gemmatimonadota bacterium]